MLLKMNETNAIATLSDSVRTYAEAAKSKNTLRAYKADFASFESWCGACGLRAMPADGGTVALYLSHLGNAGKKASTITRAAAAIATVHKLKSHTSPLADAKVATVLAGIRRSKGTAPTRKAPITIEDLRAISATCASDAAGIRDRAVLLTGWAGAFRRSEIAALQVSDVAFQRDGVVVTLRKSKTDQTGEGRNVGIPYGSDPKTCPVRTLQSWLKISNVKDGALFRSVGKSGRIGDSISDRTVAEIVKSRALNAGLGSFDFSGHSLRAGFVTTAAKAGKTLDAIMAQTGHRSTATALGYIRRATVFERNAASGIGL